MVLGLRGSLKRTLIAGAAVIIPASSMAQVAGNPSQVSDDSLRVSIGATYAEGRYGQAARSEIATLPVSVKYTHSSFSVKVTVLYVHINGPGTLLDGTGSGSSGSSGSSEVSEQETETGTGGAGAGTDGGSGAGTGETETGDGGIVANSPGPVVPLPLPLKNRGGLGDTTIAIAYALPLGQSLWLEPRGRVKLPTASTSKGIGTGKVDITLAADLVGTFGPATLYAGARRRFLGHSVRFPLRDGWGLSGGGSYQVSPAVVVGADYDWLQSATPGRGPISEASAWISLRLNHTLRLQAYGGTGLSSRSADSLAGLTLVWRP